MIEIPLIGIGGGMLLAGGMATLDSKKKKWALVAIAGLILVIIGLTLPIINDSDCRNYCQCKGYAGHEYMSYEHACECLETPKEVLECVRKCGSKDSHYNEFNGRCYCT